MRKKLAWQSWLLMFWPYSLILTVLGMTQQSLDGALVLLCIWMLLTLVVCGLAIWCAVKERENAPWQGMLIKLVHIPFYVMVFLFAAITIAAPVLTIGLFLLDVLLMLTTSAYGVIAALRGLRKGQLHLLAAVPLIAGHCLFVADVVCSVLLFILSIASVRRDGAAVS